MTNYIHVRRYLTVTMCGKACPCPDSVVVTLFWIGEQFYYLSPLKKWVSSIFEENNRTFTNIKGYFNSTLNPVIYAMTNRDFKLAFIGILKKMFCCDVTGVKMITMLMMMMIIR